MTFMCYVEKNFSAEHMKIIAAANHIIEEYQAKGFNLTLRQIYYQFVTRGWIANKDSEYKRLGSLLNDGRLAGLVSWSAIEDRNRNLMGLRTWKSPLEAVQDARSNYRIDKWYNQEFIPEVWVEKAALEGVVGDICNRLQVDFFSCRGYNSQSEQWRAGRRFARYVQGGRRPIVFHLGDHDPSGLDMTRDNRERLSMFAGFNVVVDRLALNMAQIEQYGPPPNPAKISDVRYTAYANEFGSESWELDALDPKVIQDLIEAAVLRVRDETKWAHALDRESAERAMIEEVESYL